MTTFEKTLAVVGVLDFVGAIIAGILDARTASIGMIAVALLVWLCWLTAEVLKLRSKEMPRDAETDRTSALPVIRHFEKPREFTARNRSKYHIESNFLTWDQCTIMLWIKIPAKGLGLRDNSSNRYFLSHFTKVAHDRGYPYLNRFSIGYLTKGEVWTVIVSNSRVEQAGEHRVAIKDGLDPGWHHFTVTWDRSKPILEFIIGAEDGTRDFSTGIFQFWPDGFADKVTVGSWVTEHEGFFCETQLCNLVIFDKHVKSIGAAFKSHTAERPGI